MTGITPIPSAKNGNRQNNGDPPPATVNGRAAAAIESQQQQQQPRQQQHSHSHSHSHGQGQGQQQGISSTRYLYDESRAHLRCLLGRLQQGAPNVEVLLYEFCRTLHSLPNAGPTQHFFDGLMDELSMEGGIDVILYILTQPHHRAETYEWALASLIWFIYGSNERATMAVSRDAFHCIIVVTRQYRQVERLHGAALAALSHLLGHAHPASVLQAIADSEHQYIEELVTSLEHFPLSIHVYKHACAAFGAIYSLIYSNNGPHPNGRSHQIEGFVQRILACTFRGLLDHSVWDDECRHAGRSMLNLLLGRPSADRILQHADSQICHGGAA